MQATHSGNPLVGIALFGWVPFVLLLFTMLPPRRAALIAFLAGSMFLPSGGFKIHAFPEYNKTTAICVGILLSALIFDTGRITRFKPHWLDLFPIMYCVTPFFSSLSNNLGAYDGVSALTGSVISWLFPYFIGRLYFSDLQGMRELILGFFIAGMVYMPFCLFEIRMSPHLHYWIYGFSPTAFVHHIRSGGYRPVVFMGTGLRLTLFMGFTTLSGFGLWFSKVKTSFLGLPLWVSVFALALTTLLCKSVGAFILMLVGMGSLVIIKHLRTSAPVALLACAAVAYIVFRGSGLWSGMELVDMASIFGPEREGSLRVRIVNETALAERARERLLLGWGGWGDSRIKDEHGRDISITDGFWIIVFGTRGTLGLIAFAGTILGPVFLVIYQVSGRYWAHPAMMPAVIALLIICLWLVDSITNAMYNPIYIVTAGGLASLKAVKVTQRQSVKVRPKTLETAAASAADKT